MRLKVSGGSITFITKSLRSSTQFRISPLHINHFKEIMGVDEIIHNGIVAVNEDICLCIGVEEAYGESIRPVRQSNIL